ncbi:hypothetical protein BpHYR1_022878 [Brachionus plicatilis]|uniref:Uncharacterized protein n=1 Tax=Brachionus plicatilis TaxID=10195 RepID=A0A3M7PJV4_BRAPC|nr:hypothetical protein BpHYR1_022878 [Brachionus plicatilis]
MYNWAIRKHKSSLLFIKYSLAVFSPAIAFSLLINSVYVSIVRDGSASSVCSPCSNATKSSLYVSPEGTKSSQCRKAYLSKFTILFVNTEPSFSNSS